MLEHSELLIEAGQRVPAGAGTALRLLIVSPEGHCPLGAAWWRDS